MSAEFKKNEDDAQAIVERLEQVGGPEEQYDTGLYGVHNGHCMVNDSYTSVNNLRREDYFQHSVEFHNYLDRALDDDTAFNVVYRDGDRENTLEYLGEFSETVDFAIESSRMSGFINRESEKEKLADSINRLSDGAEIQISGEINGLCVSQFEDLIRAVSRLSGKDLGVTVQTTFPHKPLDRTQGRLHWKGKVPDYLKAMEVRSKF